LNAGRRLSLQQILRDSNSRQQKTANDVEGYKGCWKFYSGHASHRSPEELIA